MTDSLESCDDRRDQLDRRLERERQEAREAAERLPAFILASASPRRRELLATLGLSFEIHPADLPEVPRSGEHPEQFVARAASEKAAHIASRHSGRRVLGADTIVALGGAILGKPRDRDHAREMLLHLSATTHRVCTGIAVVEGDLAETVVVTSEVAFRPMTTAEIETYIDSGEPFDKAGGYGIQSGGGQFVTSLSGSYSNVIGLPLVETMTLLSRSRRQR